MLKEELIELLIKDGYLKSTAVIDAFKKIDRKNFLPDEVSAKGGSASGGKVQAYENIALPIGYKQTISQPLVVAFMLELLELKTNEKILEIGAGSGWVTALMAQIIGETGKIISIERIEELYKFAKNNLLKYGFVEKGIVNLILADGSKGNNENAPYDKIVAAASADEIPQEWKDQLKIGGKLVAPLKDSIIVMDKISKDTFEMKEYFGFSFVPLIKE